MEARKPTNWKTQRDYLRLAVNLGDVDSPIAHKRKLELNKLTKRMGCNSYSELFQKIADQDIELRRVK